MILGFIIMYFVPMSVLNIILYKIICIFLKEDKKSFLYHFTRYIFLECIMSLIYLTIFWGGIDLNNVIHHINLHPFIWLKEVYKMGNSRMIFQLIINIIMFIPYGLLLPLTFKNLRKWDKTLLVVFITTFFIEFIQYFIGRSTDIDDLIMNFIGGCIGYIIYFFVNKLFKNKTWYKNI